MDIPINVDVYCALEPCGRSTSLIVNPVNEEVTHIVVTEKNFPYIKRLVPISEIFESTPHAIKLRCTPEKFAHLEPYEETDFISEGSMESSLPYKDPYLVWPYSLYEGGPLELNQEHIPAGEIAIHLGTPVHAKDGKVGKVDEFLVDPTSNHITHLVLREGHLWGQKDVTIPVSEINTIGEDEVYLRLGKEAIEKLPAVPVIRNWK